MHVDDAGLLAHFAEWKGRRTGRTVAAFGPQDSSAALYAADELLVDALDRDLVEELTGRYGAELLSTGELPSPPDGLEVREVRGEEPVALRLKFREVPRVEGQDDLLARAADAFHGEVVATCDMGAAVAALAVRCSLDERPAGLNLFGEPFAMPLSTATEGPVPGAGPNAFTWSAFAGRSRIVEAWQLMDSIQRMGSSPFVVLAVLDDGFWLDNSGAPNVAPGQAGSDLGSGVMQLNLMAEGTPAGGMSSGSPWHGNAVVSAAAATVANSLGAAGSGGLVVQPMVFRTDISIDHMMRCARMCAAWGIDVLNMSIGTWGQTELFFPTSTWDRTFRFAADNGVVMIAAAGNSELNLPDDENIRPATRTPDVLTIGNLDTNDTAAPRSNFGSSVGLWAPGTGIPVMPDGNNPSGRLASGTSFAAPIVAGVAAMMRAANQSLSARDIRRILVETAWPGSGRVSRGLDAFAALFAAVSSTIPDSDEPNNTPATARTLIATGPGGALQPGLGPFTTRSKAGDTDYWRFTVDKFSTTTVTVDFYERLSTLGVLVEAEDPDGRGPDDMVRTGSATSGRIVLSGLLPPGGYRIRITGSGVTAYSLVVGRRAAVLPRDVFEVNDSFESAAPMLFVVNRWSPFLHRSWGPGTYDATLHRERTISPYIGGGSSVVNEDFFRLDVPERTIFSRPAVTISDADRPLDLVLYDERRVELERWTGVRERTVYPPEWSTCYLKVTGPDVTRYRIGTRMTVDTHVIPGPWQEIEVIPKWWGDPPPLVLIDEISHYLHEVGPVGHGPALVFDAAPDALRIELIDRTGEVIREARQTAAGLALETQDLEEGPYVVQLTRRTDETIPVRVVPPMTRTPA